MSTYLMELVLFFVVNLFITVSKMKSLNNDSPFEKGGLGDFEVVDEEMFLNPPNPLF